MSDASTQPRVEALARRMMLSVAVAVTLGPMSLLGGAWQWLLLPGLAGAALSARYALAIRTLQLKAVDKA